MPITRKSSRTKNDDVVEENKQKNKEEKLKVGKSKTRLTRNTEDVDDSFSFFSKDNNPQDAFDLLRLSPMKQEVSFKPLSFWSKKVKDLESKENIKKKKRELYDLSETDDSSLSKGSNYKDKKPKKRKGRPAIGRQRKNKIGFDFNSKNLMKSRQNKSNSENKDGSIIRERIILRRLNDRVKDSKEKFSFKNVTAFGLTSTPGKSQNLNLVGGSTFNFLSPISVPGGIPQIAAAAHSEPELDTCNSKGDSSENKEMATPRRLRKRIGGRQVVTKDLKGVSGSENETIDPVKSSYTIWSKLGDSLRGNIENSEVGNESLVLSTGDKVLNLDSYEDYIDKLNTSFLYTSRDDLSEEIENFKPEYPNVSKGWKISEELIHLLFSLKILFTLAVSQKKLIDLSSYALRLPARQSFLSAPLQVRESGMVFGSEEEIPLVEDAISSDCRDSVTLVSGICRRNSVSKVTIRRCYNNLLNFRHSAKGESFELSLHENISKEISSSLIYNGTNSTKSLSLHNSVPEDFPITLSPPTDGMRKWSKQLTGSEIPIDDMENVCSQFYSFADEAKFIPDNSSNLETVFTSNSDQMLEFDSIRDHAEPISEEIKGRRLNGDFPDYALDVNSKIGVEVIILLYSLKILLTHGKSGKKFTDLSCFELKHPSCHLFQSVSLPVGEHRQHFGLKEEYSIVEDLSLPSICRNSDTPTFRKNSFSNVTVRRCYKGFSNFKQCDVDENCEFSRCLNSNSSRIGFNNLTLDVSSLVSKEPDSCHSVTENFDLLGTDTIDREPSWTNESMSEDQQTHGKPSVKLVSDDKMRSNQFCSKVESVSPIREHLQLFSAIGNDSSVFISSPETSPTVGSLNCSVCKKFGDNGKALPDCYEKLRSLSNSAPEDSFDQVEPVCDEKSVKTCHGRVKKQSEGNESAPYLSFPVKSAPEEQIISDITVTEELNFLHPIFESTRCATPVMEKPIDLVGENRTVEESSLVKGVREGNRSEFELSEITSCRLKPGKKWAKSAMILKKSLSGTLLNHTVQKGRMYETFAKEVLSMQADAEGENAFKIDGSSVSLMAVVNMMSNMSIKRDVTGNRTVKVLELDSEDREVDFSFRSIFRNSLCSTVTDGNNAEVTSNTRLKSAREQVLMLCKKQKCLPFEEYFNKSTLKHCKKIGEGTFGEVFSCESKRVIKIMPIEGPDEVNGEKQKKFDEILTEMVIARELSNLRIGDKHRTSGFCKLSESWCVKGKYPKYLIDLWNDFDKLGPGSENDSPTMFNSDQLYIVLEFGHGGEDLEAFIFNTVEQALAIFFQVTFSLAVAEKRLEFEHRDLHWGNILIAPTKKKFFEVILNGEEIRIPTKGVEVTIIDFTLSRITYDGCCIYNDLSVDPTLFTSEGDYQFEVYRLMKRELGNDWSLFRPKTNIFWLHYVADKMVNMARYKKQRAETKTHRKSLAKLNEIKSSILRFSDSEDLAFEFRLIMI